MKKTINENQFRIMVKKYIKEFAEKNLFSGEEAMDVDLNKMDGVDGKSNINLGTEKNKVKNPSDSSQDPLKVTMNKTDGVDGKSNINLGTEKNKVKNPSDSSQDPLKVTMNKMDSVDGKKNVNLGTTKNPIKESTDPLDVKMNQYDKDLGQVTKDASPLVKVDAKKSTHERGEVKGMAKAEFDKKNGMNDSKNYNGGKNDGEVHFDVDMNKNDDKVDGDVPKTYVEAGKEGKDGQHDVKVFDKAQNEKDAEPIAKGIQLPEGFENKTYTKKELYNFIISEAKKIVDEKKVL